MSDSTSFDVVIIGGGLGGLVCAIELARAGISVALLEKKDYPFHKVCGEYVSNEVLTYLQSLGFDPFEYGAAMIKRLRLSTPSGKNITAALPLGGFGLSRFTMDDALRQLAARSGASIFTGEKVTDVKREGERFTAVTQDGASYSATFAIGAWGKRDVMDKKLDRSFLRSHTGYLGVKYHIRTDYPADEIGLDNFPGGYCGISRVEGGKYNLCYLYQRDFGGQFKSMKELEERMLHQNPVLRRIFSESDFLWEKPEVINEISFASKRQVESGIFMCGDTAGLITPLCGNGMSMAIAAAKLLSGLIVTSRSLMDGPVTPPVRAALEAAYSKAWKEQFGRRLYWGRAIQKAFGAPMLSEIVLRTLHAIPPVERWLINQTHGEPLGEVGR